MKEKIKHNGIYFSLNFSNPKNRKHYKKPCRALVTPLDSETGKEITKRQLYGKNSDCPVNQTLYGKNEDDIKKKFFPAAADATIAQTKQVGLLNTDQSDDIHIHDFAEVARDFKGMFFDLHRNGWSKPTFEEYQHQYDRFVGQLSGVTLETLTQDGYLALQECICRNALKTSRKMSDWEMGEKAPSSAQKQLNLLYLLLWDLKMVGEYAIPLIPVRYAGKISRQDLLLQYIDNARSIPSEQLKEVFKEDILSSQLGILLDTGLRISEYGGLLFCSVNMVDGSQGPMYYLRITGQLGADNKRTEILKTDPSYRVISLSKELGEILINRQKTLEQQYGDISLQLLCGRATAESYCTTPEVLAEHMKDITEYIPKLLRDPKIVNALKENRPYIFDVDCQDKHLVGMLTCHALRRNFCTSLYCQSGINTKSIYQQMGHADKSTKRRSGASGATSDELYRMCLQKHVSSTLYHPAHPLKYNADGEVTESEVPACKIQLTIPPNSKWELVVDGSEPLSNITISGENVVYKQERQDDRRDMVYDCELLADEQCYTILGTGKLFD